MKIYLAGPDVFRPDARQWMAQARETCRRHGFEPLTPLDHEEIEAAKIFKANIDLIRAAQIVVANLNPFRGAEPDSGTCFELGYALALDKQIFGYVERFEILRARVNRAEGCDPARTRDNQGMAIEDFGLSLNLMLAVPARIVEGGLEECLSHLRGGTLPAVAPAASLPDNPAIRKTLEAAIRYLRWVADGKISDDHAVATVAEHYKVREEKVRGWVDAWSGVSLAAHADYRPDDVIRQMKISGRQFRSFT